MAARAWTPKARPWQVAPPFEGAQAMARELATSELVAQILHNRGVGSAAEGKAFLNPKLTDLHDPLLLSGVKEAAGIVARAVAAGSQIVIYGDYDVDGMTAVAILHACLKMLGAKAEFYVPHRLEEGYGVNADAVAKIVADGCKLLITVDCGISAAEPLASAVAAGVEVIVTDHHSLGDVLPAATIVHPRLGQYPNADLSGAGVAFKLAWQVAREVGGHDRVDQAMRDFLVEATCLAALGTIADVMPLRGENRVLAAYGLRGLPGTKHPGLRALLASADLAGEKLDAYHVGFVLGPRLNACGRMGHAGLAVELLTDAPEARCREIADYLAQQNVERQKIERSIADHAAEMVVAGGLDREDSRAIVLSCDQWHGGVIGIVASRMVDRFSRPAVLIAINGDGIGHGSARSIPGFHMRDALAACGEHLLSFGGHAMAGGLKIHPAKIPDFAAAMQRYARQNVTAEQLAAPLAVDAEATLAQLGYNVVAQLEKLAPFGEGNPPPVVVIRGCKLLADPRRMGRSGNAVSLNVAQGSARMRAVGFGMGDLADRLRGINTIDLVAEPCLNRFNGSVSVELKLKDVAW